MDPSEAETLPPTFNNAQAIGESRYAHREQNTQADPTGAAAPAAAQQSASPPMMQEYFRWRPLPWWLCFLGGVFLLTKFQVVYNDSPCAVLGTQSPVGMAEVKRAFRTLSMCTHPDRLRGRLKRQPTSAESRRGEIIFNRASAAKDELSKVLKGSKKKVKCYQGELELALLQFFAELGTAISRLGITDYTSMVWDMAYNLVTFHAGFWNTVLSVLWLMFIFRLFKQFFFYLWRMGLLRGFVAFFSTIIIGPLPTLVHFLVLPAIRFAAFLQDACLGPKIEAELVQAPSPSNEEVQAAATPETTMSPKENSSAHVAAATEGPNKNVLKQRRKKETEAEKERRNKELLNNTSAAAASSAEATNPGTAAVPTAAVAAGPMPEDLWQCVRWSHREPVRARQDAANAVQFDLLLIITKPVIPLFMLIALGQVWNGLFSSLFIGHALRRWVPRMSYEAHHLLCSFFGIMHTLLGVSAQQVEDYANASGVKILHLVWSWSFKDVLAVMHMAMLGSTVTAMAGLGNEPSYAASFAAGIATRIAIGQDSIRGLGLVRNLAGRVDVGLREMGVALDQAEEAVAYSGNGIGDCGGGPFRMLFGDGPEARWAAFALKMWLALLPFLSTLQWLQRTVHAGRNIGKKFKLKRFIQRVILCVLGLVQCIMIANVELNASNGALGNFWVAMLFGCTFESFLSTVDIRGPVRQILFLLLFLLI